MSRSGPSRCEVVSPTAGQCSRLALDEAGGPCRSELCPTLGEVMSPTLGEVMSPTLDEVMSPIAGEVMSLTLGEVMSPTAGESSS